MDLLYYNI